MPLKYFNTPSERHSKLKTLNQNNNIQNMISKTLTIDTALMLNTKMTGTRPLQIKHKNGRMCPQDMNPTLSLSKQGHNCRMEKRVKFEIKLSFLFMVPDFVYKFQMICLRGTLVTEWKHNTERMYG